MPFSEITGDYYRYLDDFDASEQERLLALDSLLRSQAAPIVNDYWARAEFPRQLVRPLADLGIFGTQYEESGNGFTSARFRGWVTLILASVDASLATFLGVQSGLGSGSIGQLGSAEQRDQWLPRLGSCDVIAACGITEPQSGSDTARGINTTAERRGDEWVLNGRKRWIGNGTWSDITIVYARSTEDGKVKAFIVPTDAPGYVATKIEDKQSLRIVQNADITLTDVVVSEENRLPGCEDFSDLTRVLRYTRAENGWIATGLQFGALQHALAYAGDRVQFGKPIASYQLMQELLVNSLGNATASLAMVERLATLMERPDRFDEQAALSKAFTSTKARETVAWCRELFGGNGIDLQYGISRFFCDAEAVHTYEGTREMNTLIVGRDITGISAFV